MLVAERHDRIVQLVNERGSMRVTELSETFGVTEETIRRDLDALEARGALRRSHGGAVKVSEQLESPYFERVAINAAEKKEIAEEALKYVKAGDQIILDASTTAFYMAAAMANIPLTVLTNSIKVAAELAHKERITVIATGGILSPRSLSFVGPSAERALDMYHVNKAFLSCKGVHFERGITESNELQALVKRKMLQIADECYLLVDHSKFDVQDFAHVGQLADVHMIVTDAMADPAYVEQLRIRQLSVVQVQKHA